MWPDPFRFWADMARTSVKLGEMAQASSDVIDSRTRTMFDACRDPLNGNYEELARMVPEKVAAFWEAGIASLADLQAAQAAGLANWQQATALAFSGSLPTPAAVEAFAKRSSRAARHVSAAGEKAIAPVHRRVTSNARRLKKRRS